MGFIDYLTKVREMDSYRAYIYTYLIYLFFLDVVLYLCTFNYYRKFTLDTERIYKRINRHKWKKSLK